MTFTKDHSIPNSYVVLILAGLRTYESVPDVGNLRQIVAEILLDEQK